MWWGNRDRIDRRGEEEKRNISSVEKTSSSQTNQSVNPLTNQKKKKNYQQD